MLLALLSVNFGAVSEGEGNDQPGFLVDVSRFDMYNVGEGLRDILLPRRLRYRGRGMLHERWRRIMVN